MIPTGLFSRSGTMLTKRRTKFDTTRHRIVLQAMQCFAEKSFHGTSICEIAREGNLSKETIYRHFPDKQALLRSVLAHYAWRCRFPIRSTLGAVETHAASGWVSLAHQINVWNDTNHVADFYRLVNSTVSEYPAGGLLFWNSIYSRVRQVIKIVLVCNGLSSKPTEFSEMAVDQILALLLTDQRWWRPEICPVRNKSTLILIEKISKNAKTLCEYSNYNPEERSFNTVKIFLHRDIKPR